MTELVPVNYFAVLLAAISTLVVGTLWYGPLFGKPWMAMMFTPEQIAEGKKKDMGGMWKTYLAQFLGSVVMAYVLSHLIVFSATYFKTTGVTVGLSSAFWAWLGFVFPVMLGTVLWDGRPKKLFYINAGHYLASMLVMGAIIACVMWPKMA